MHTHIELGRIRGIRIGLHYSWFLIALLLLLSFSASFAHRYPSWSLPTVSAMAVPTTLLFFGSLLLHELAHSLLALHYGMRVREITLFALGGVSQIEGEPAGPASEFWVAVVGPATSAAIGGAGVAAASLLPAMLSPLSLMLEWIGIVNLSIAAFNLLPGYPMDGGRILRALLWWKWGDLSRATRTAARAGTILAIAFIAFGVLEFFTGSSLGGLWIVFVGWFLLEASRGSDLDVRLREELSQVRVRDLMITEPATVDGRVTVQDFVDHELLRTARRCFVVRENGAPVGIVTPHDVRRVERTVWSTTPVELVMHPLDTLRSVQPADSLLEALRAMANADLNQVPVVQGNRCVGLLSRAEVLACLRNRVELESCQRQAHPSCPGSFTKRPDLRTRWP